MRAESQVPSVQRQYYEELFKLADLDRDGEIGVTDAAFFRKSMLPIETLSDIWVLSDVKNGKLDIEDFIVALKLISLAQLGAPISLDSIRAMPVVPPPRLQEVPPIQFDWVVPPNEKANYVEIFNRNDEDSDGYISGDQAKTLFSQSGLPGKLLGHIWFLSDMNGDRRLDCQEFIVATFLIRSVLKGYELPTKLPEALIQSSKYISSAGIVSPKVPEWLIPPAERIIYEDIFNKNQQNGRITGLQAKNLFEKSGLPVMDLKQIWDLSDYNQEQHLDRQKFVIAMYLIAQRKKKKELPASLPQVLLDSSKSTFQPTSPPPSANPNDIGGQERVKSGKYDFNLDEIVSSTTPVVGATPPVTSPGADALAVVPSTTGSIDNSNNFGVAPPVPSNIDSLPKQQPPQLQQQPSMHQMISPPPQPTLHHQHSQSHLQYMPQMAPPTPTQVQSNLQSPTQTYIGQSQTKDSIDKVRQQTLEREKSLAELKNKFIEESAMSIELNKQLQTETKSLEDITLEINEHEDKLATQKQQNIEIKEKISSVRVEIKSYKGQLEQITKLLKEKSEQYDDDSETLQLLQNDLDDKRMELEKYNQEIANLKASIDAIKSQKSERKTDIQQVNKAANDAKAEVKRLNEEFKQLKVQQPQQQQISSSGGIRQSSDNFASPSNTTAAFDDGWSLFNTTSVVTATPPANNSPATTNNNPLQSSSSGFVKPSNVTSPPPQTTTTTTTTTTANVVSPASNVNNFFSSNGSGFFDDDAFSSFGSSGSSVPNTSATVDSKTTNLFNVADDNSSSSHKADAGSDLSFNESSNLFSSSSSNKFGAVGASSSNSSGFDTFDSFSSAKDPYSSAITNSAFSFRESFIVPRSSTPLQSIQQQQTNSNSPRNSITSPNSSSSSSFINNNNTNNNTVPLDFNNSNLTNAFQQQQPSTTTTATNNTFDSNSDRPNSEFSTGGFTNAGGFDNDSNEPPVGEEVNGFEDSFDASSFQPVGSDSSIKIDAPANTPFNTPSNSIATTDLFGPSTPFGPPTTTTDTVPSDTNNFFFDDNAFTEKFNSNFSTNFDDSSFNPF